MRRLRRDRAALVFGVLFALPPIVALAVYLAIVVVAASALVDIAVAWLDPRIRRARPSA